MCPGTTASLSAVPCGGCGRGRVPGGRAGGGAAAGGPGPGGPGGSAELHPGLTLCREPAGKRGKTAFKGCRSRWPLMSLKKFMLGNGVKRKLNEDEDGLEEDVRPSAVGGMSQASYYTLQRQTVLNMSLMKLYGPRAGGREASALSSSLLQRLTLPPHVRMASESYRQPPPPPSSFSILSSSLSGLTALDSCLTPASLLEEDLPMFFTLPPSSSSQHHHHHLHHSLRPPPPPSPSPKDSFSSALEEIEELCPSSSSPSSSGPPSPPPARVLFDVVMKEEGRSFQEVESRLEKPLPPSSSSPGSFLTDFALGDVLF
ncbi:hypothetical protein L3Q82_020095 [Scortum barcoo]|uniref:Uncharacterized protein n=1 Tax=Scortum barcoo TaxID=214431 RepID=A0ACB8VDQ1_9TELE|nr:hypothetical protein L3Q82_020095 [Scortum barcoo]